MIPSLLLIIKLSNLIHYELKWQLIYLIYIKLKTKKYINKSRPVTTSARGAGVNGMWRKGGSMGCEGRVGLSLESEWSAQCSHFTVWIWDLKNKTSLFHSLFFSFSLLLFHGFLHYPLIFFLAVENGPTQGPRASSSFFGF